MRINWSQKSADEIKSALRKAIETNHVQNFSNIVSSMGADKVTPDMVLLTLSEKSNIEQSKMIDVLFEHCDLRNKKTILQALERSAKNHMFESTVQLTAKALDENFPVLDVYHTVFDNYSRSMQNNLIEGLERKGYKDEIHQQATLYGAVVARNVLLLDRLIKKGVDVQAFDNKIIDLAMQKQDEALVKRLTKSMQDPFLHRHRMNHSYAVFGVADDVLLAQRQCLEKDKNKWAGYCHDHGGASADWVLDVVDKKTGDTGLMAAARAQGLDRVIEMLQQKDRRLPPVQDLLRENNRGQNAITILAERKALSTVLDQKFWAGRRADLITVMENLPEFYRKESGVDAFITQTARSSMRRARPRPPGGMS